MPHLAPSPARAAVAPLGDAPHKRRRRRSESRSSIQNTAVDSIAVAGGAVFSHASSEGASGSGHVPALSTNIESPASAAPLDSMSIPREAHVIQHLGSGQGTVSVVAALMAAFGFSILQSQMEKLNRSTSLVGLLFLASSIGVVAGNICVAILCAIFEQQAKIAVGMSLLRQCEAYNRRLERWWGSFAPLRAYSLLAFFFMVPMLFISLAMGVLLNAAPAGESLNDGGLGAFFRGLYEPLPALSGMQIYVSIASAGAFLVAGIVCSCQVYDLSAKFREHVLQITGVFAVPRVTST